MGQKSTRSLRLPVLAAVVSALLLGAAAASYAIRSRQGPVLGQQATVAVQHIARVPEPLVAPAQPAQPVLPGVTLSIRPDLVPVLKPGLSGEKVRDLQARLRQLAWYAGPVTGRYDATTRAAVAGFQGKRGMTASGIVDGRTLTRLGRMSTTPSHAEKHNLVASSSSTSAPLDPRCRTGRAICVDKTGQTLRWVVDGTVRATMAVRFGASYTPTREGLFHVSRKSADHVSTLFHSSMPFAMFFSGGQAVHYSSDFAARGYAGASHGCVNVRDYVGVRWLFAQVSVGDAVVVYRS